MTRWGIIGCGDVTEVKSGPGFQKADRSALVAVMRRDLAKAQDYARRHGVPRAYDRAGALIDDPEVDAVYIATPPSSHCELALAVAAAGKPCLVEKPMAMNHGECLRMIEAFAARGVPLWVAYYRRALPRFLIVRDLLAANAIGRVTSVRVEVTKPLATTERSNWRFDPAIAGAGLLFDLGSHCVDLLDFFLGPITGVAGFPDQHRRRLRGGRRDRSRVQLRQPGRGHGDLEFQRCVHGGHDDVHRIGRRAGDADLQRYRRDRHQRTRTAGAPGPLPAARPPAADSDHRRRARGRGAVPVNR